MQKITVRRIVLGSVLLCMSIFALLTLCFNVIYIDGEILQANVYADNGFSLIGRKSFFLTGLKEVNMKNADALISVCQSLAILFLIMAVASVCFTVLGFFFDKSEKTFKAAVVIIMVEVIGFMVVGIVVRAVFISAVVKNSSIWETIFGTQLGQSDMLVVEKALKEKVKTAAFAPLIIAAIFLIGYIVCDCLVKNGKVLDIEKKDGSTVAVVPSGAACYFIKIDVQYLRELKQIFDEGILTEEEFMEQKRLALGKKE